MYDLYGDPTDISGARDDAPMETKSPPDPRESFAIVYISIVRRKQAEKALAPSAFFLAFGCGSSCGATPVP